MPIMSTRGSISVRFVNHLVPRLPVTRSYRVATTPGDSGTSYTTTLVTTSSGEYRIPQSALYTTPGRYTWICPAGVTAISVMCVGGGGGGGTYSGSYAGANGGGGGGYAYMYDYPVTPGVSYTIQVGAGGETAERYGSQYWDNEDNGITSDKGGYSSTGGGGVASWFNSRTVCRGGGGMNGTGASWNGTTYTTGYAFGGYWTLGAGLSGSGLAGGFSDDVQNGASGPAAFGGGGGAGSSSTEGGFDTAGSGSYYSGASYSGASTGGGGGGGGGYNAGGANQTVIARSDVAWSPFMNTYGVWVNNLSVNESYVISKTFNATQTATYNFQISADNSMSLYVDGTLIGSTTNFEVDNPDPIPVALDAGSHTLTFVVVNNESSAGFATLIKRSTTNVWNTRTNLVNTTVYPTKRTAGGGGGIGIYQITATAPGSGAAGTLADFQTESGGGGGGSGGQAGYSGENIAIQAGTATPSNGGRYGGGGGGGKTYSGRGASGGHGAVRVIWSAGSAYPSTSGTDVYAVVPIALPAPNTYQLSQQANYTICGSYTWICPPGVTTVSVFCVGGGGGGGAQYNDPVNGTTPGGTSGGGGGGAYAYITDYPVTPGNSYTVVAGCGGYIPYYIIDGGDSYFNDTSTVLAGGGKTGNTNTAGAGRTAAGGAGGTYTIGPGLTGSGSNGGAGGPGAWYIGLVGGGGGAGSGPSNGRGGGFGYPTSVGANGGGGGGATDGTISTSPAIGAKNGGGGGGGIGIFGIGSSGAAGDNGTYPYLYANFGGGGGSGGEPGGGTIFSPTSSGVYSGAGGRYGGGGGGGHIYLGYSLITPGRGADGAVRILWGSGRAYPSTGTSDVYTSVSF